MNKALISIGLLAAATTAFAGKPADGGDTTPTPSGEYGYVGNTSQMFSHSPNLISTRVSVIDINGGCVAEFGVGARIALSREIASAMSQGTYTPPSENYVFIWPSEITTLAHNGASSHHVYDPHLNILVDTVWGMILGTPRAFTSLAKSSELSAYAACSVPQ
jgi:hypothetical protein